MNRNSKLEGMGLKHAGHQMLLFTCEVPAERPLVEAQMSNLAVVEAGRYLGTSLGQMFNFYLTETQ
jgi:hypothetical protein